MEFVKKKERSLLGRLLRAMPFRTFLDAVALVFEDGKFKIEERRGNPEGVATVEYQQDPDGHEYLEMVLNDEAVEDAGKKAMALLEKLKKRYEEMGRLFGDGVEAFTETLDMLVEVEEPYTTRGVKVHRLRDTGGDHPRIEVEYEYLA